jgi:hypothetical protein
MFFKQYTVYVHATFIQTCYIAMNKRIIVKTVKYMHSIVAVATELQPESSCIVEELISIYLDYILSSLTVVDYS